MVNHEITVAIYFKELYRIGIYPRRLSTSVESTIAALKTFDRGILKTANCSCAFCRKVGNISEKSREIGAQAGSWGEDICLDCMRHGGRNTGNCRMRHD